MTELRLPTFAAALALLVASGTCLASSAWAAGDTVSRDDTSTAAEVNRYWTPERLRSAKPMEPAAVIDPSIAPRMQRPSKPAQSYFGDGAAPAIDPAAMLDMRLLPEGTVPDAAKHADIHRDATSSFGAFFTTYRVFPSAATTAYPNRVAGKLFFTDTHTKGNFYCSASVLRPRIIVTAGHCATHPSTDSKDRYFYGDFLFVPAYSDGAAPYGSWTPSQEWVTNTWFESNGTVPNAQDVAILIAKDQEIFGKVNTIGAVTGWLGYQTEALSTNNVTMLGYPCNLDSCDYMELTNAQTFESGGSNTYIYGSAMKGGASGGPWIQDYGVAPTGTPAPTSPLGLNRLVAVTSYQPTDTSLEYLGASELDNDFLTILNDACSAGSGNC